MNIIREAVESAWVDAEKREGLSADCTLSPMLAVGILMMGKEHPCDRCNMDRKKCRGYPRR